jgi:hypothetical protein
VSGGSDSKTISWTKSGGDFLGDASATSIDWRAPADAADGQTFTITATVVDDLTQNQCADSATATASVPPTGGSSLNISLKMQGRSNSHPRGHSGTADIFAREPNGSSKLWEANDLTVNTSGNINDVEVSGLSIGGTYEFLLKGFIHLTKKLSHTLTEGVNNLDFGTILTGDFDGNDQVNSLDNDVLLTGWQQTWNSPQACDGEGQSYTDCNRADFNLDSKVNSIDWDYIFTNWGKNGDQ